MFPVPRGAKEVRPQNIKKQNKGIYMYAYIYINTKRQGKSGQNKTKPVGCARFRSSVCAAYFCQGVGNSNTACGPRSHLPLPLPLAPILHPRPHRLSHHFGACPGPRIPIRNAPSAAESESQTGRCLELGMLISLLPTSRRLLMKQ